MVSSFELDKYEVTVGRFRHFVSAWDDGSGYEPPAGSGKHIQLNGGRGLVDVSIADAGTVYESGWISAYNSNIAPTNSNLTTACSDPTYASWTSSAATQENLPINCVNWYEAYAFCIWDGGFLPSESEFEYAAAGGGLQREYPWGSTPPGTGNQYAIYDCYYPNGSGTCTSGATNIAAVGTATLGAGLWGQLDLVGEVGQWNLDWYAPYVDPCTDCAYLTGVSDRVLRGGGWGGYFDNTMLTLYLLPPSRNSVRPMYRDVGTGFRCARTP